MYGVVRATASTSTVNPTGWDVIIGPVGTDVHAIANGKVTQILTQTSLGGQMVVIQHDGYSSVYVHLSEVDVEEGDQVDVGDTIGL